MIAREKERLDTANDDNAQVRAVTPGYGETVAMTPR
jgi:hypothetical protein